MRDYVIVALAHLLLVIPQPRSISSDVKHRTREYALSETTFGDPGITLSTLLKESDFNSEELASNHRVQEINVKYLYQEQTHGMGVKPATS